MARLVLLFVRGDESKLYSRGIVVERCRIRLTPSRDSISLRESINFIPMILARGRVFLNHQIVRLSRIAIQIFYLSLDIQ